jgi:putative transposase
VALFGHFGQCIDSLNALTERARRLRCLHRAVSRNHKVLRTPEGKALNRRDRLHACIDVQCNDWLNKRSTDLTKQHPVIAIEKLRVVAMSASAAGAAGAPGRRLRYKAAFNRATPDQGCAEFRRQLR